MTTTADTDVLEQLIERLEKAEGPDRRLDFEIWLSATDEGKREAEWNPDQLKMSWDQWFECWKHDRTALPEFTGSLDAARMLGGMVVFASDIGADGLAMVTLVLDTTQSPIKEYTGIHNHLEIAWCIASLRARLHANSNA